MPKLVERCRASSSSSTNEPSSSSCVDPLAGGQLALGVLLLDRALGAGVDGRLEAFVEVGELACGRVDVDVAHARQRSVSADGCLLHVRRPGPSTAACGRATNGPSSGRARCGPASRSSSRRPRRTPTWLELASSTTADGVVLIAEHQTAGRGRLDRTWTAPPRSGLTMSVAGPARRRRRCRGGRGSRCSPGLAVAAALQRETGVDAQLKWPNDVLVGERKLAGLLVERVEPPRAVVAGRLP